MRGRDWLSLTPWLTMAAVALLTFTGCQSGPSQRTLASTEPALSPSVVSGTITPEKPTVVASEGATVRNVSFVDRHPLFSRPRDYYESSGSNKAIKTAAAVVVGVPAGIVGELKQIVVGAPAAPTY
jgi:hypothetical protein